MEIRSATFFWRGRVPRLRSMGLARLSEERLGVGLLATETSWLHWVINFNRSAM